MATKRWISHVFYRIYMIFYFKNTTAVKRERAPASLTHWLLFHDVGACEISTYYRAAVRRSHAPGTCLVCICFSRAACCMVVAFALSPAVILPRADDRIATSTFSSWINRINARSVAGANHLYCWLLAAHVWCSLLPRPLCGCCAARHGSTHTQITRVT